MESKSSNSKAPNGEQLNHQNDIYQDYNSSAVYDEIQNFDFLQEIASNYHNESSNWKRQLLLENQTTQNQSIENIIAIPSSSNSLLPMEQAIQPPSLTSESHKDATLDCIKDHSDVDLKEATNISPDQLDFANLDMILNEMLNNDSNQTLKRKAHNRNALYVTNSLNKSLFNEGPITKRKKTPRCNSPASTSCQSFANTRAPSPLKNYEPLPSIIPMPSPTNQNENVANVNDVLTSFEYSNIDCGYNKIDTTKLSPNTPTLDDHNIEGNLNVHDAISKLDIPHEFHSDQNVDLIDIPTYTIAKDASLNFDVPEEFSNIDNLDLMDISYPLDFEIENLDNQCSNTNHTIDPLLYREPITQFQSNEYENNKNDLQILNVVDLQVSVVDLQASCDSNTNFKLSSQRSNEPSTSHVAHDTNVDSIYVLNNDKTNLVSCDLTWLDCQEFSEIPFEKNNELQDQSYLDMIMDAIEEPIPKLNKIQVEPMVESMHSDMEKNQSIKKNRGSRSKTFVGVRKVRENVWQANLPKVGTHIKYDINRIGLYPTAEVAARVRDLIALKLKIEKHTFNFHISHYDDDLEEMQKWSEDDYIWAFKRQALGFTQSQSGFKNVYRMRQNSPSAIEKWEGRIENPKGNKKMKGFKTNITIDQNVIKEIPAIFTDLVNLHLNGWEFVTNFRRGHYTKEDVQKFITLLDKGKVHEAYEWDLIKQVLKEPLPSNLYRPLNQETIKSSIVIVENTNLLRNNSNKSAQELIPIEPSSINVENTVVPINNLNESSQGSNLQKHITETFIAKLNSKDMAKHFIECPWTNIKTLWALYRNPSDTSDLEFENIVINTYKASNWLPSEVKSYNDECKRNKEYKFYFPCVIATNSLGINMQRRILGLDYLQYLTNTPNISDIECYQKQWVNLPNIRYLGLNFCNIVACNGGLIVVKGGKNGQNINDQAKDKSTIIITNPLTYDIKFLPPIPYKLLEHKVARLVYYDSTRTTYRLIIIGAYNCEETIHDNDIQIIGTTQIALLVYCSIKESWVYSEHILNASPPFKDLGYSTIVVHGTSIYYGGLQISPSKQDFPKPVIFYFNINNSKRQQLTIDFTKAGEIYCVKVVEPPKLVQIGFNTKIYAISREEKFKEYPDILFISEVVVNEDGTPTGSFKVLAQGVMPRNLYKLLFRRTNETGGTLKMVDGEKLPPWEVMASIGHIAIKVIGFDPLIALYNVKDQNWNCTYFPYIETTLKHPNTKAWRLIPGVYEPRWTATP